MKGLQELCKQGIIDPKNLDLCESCVLGKAHRLKSTAATHTTSRILEYVHADLWGSPKVPHSSSSAQYFLYLVDDFSRKVWVYCLKHKNQAFTKFRTFEIT